MTFSNLKAWEIAQGFRNKDFSCEEVTREFLDNIKEKDSEINAYITVTEDMALKKAKEVDEKFHNREEVSPLAGIPISIKDNISVKGVKMTCASRMLENYTAPYDASLVKKIKENDDFVLYRYATEQTKGTKITSLLLQFHSTPYPLRLFGTICQSLLKRHCSPGSRSRNSIYLKAVFPSGFHGKRSSTGRC